MMHTYLEQIIAAKKTSLAVEKLRVSSDHMEKLAFDAVQETKASTPFPSTRFRKALHNSKPGLPALIAEIKKKSPSKGLLRPDFRPIEIAEAYTKSHANAISLITETAFFSGEPDDLPRVKAATHLPILRKDFLIDSYDIYRSKVLGADAILLIAAILTRDELESHLLLARQLGLECLVEIHDTADAYKAIEAGSEIIGINNRNLKSFEVNLETTEILAPLIPSNITRVSESGISSNQDLKRLNEVGIHAVLCGEVFMKSPCIEQAVNELLFPHRSNKE